MIIVSQNKENIVNFDNVNNIYIKKNDGKSEYFEEMFVIETYRRKQREFTEAVEKLSNKLEDDVKKGISPAKKLNNLSAVLDQMTKIINDILEDK